MPLTSTASPRSRSSACFAWPTSCAGSGWPMPTSCVVTGAAPRSRLAKPSAAALCGAAGMEEGLDVLRRAGRGDELALAQAAAGLDEEVALRGALDAFRGDLEVEAARQADERARELRALRVVGQAG